MKKFYIFAFFAIMALAANAQNGAPLYITGQSAGAEAGGFTKICWHIADIQQRLMIRRQQNRTCFKKHVLWMSMQEKYGINCIKPCLYLLIFAKISPKSRNFTLFK